MLSVLNHIIALILRIFFENKINKILILFLFYLNHSYNIHKRPFEKYRGERKINLNFWFIKMEKTNHGTGFLKLTQSSIDSVDFILQTYFSLDSQGQQILMEAIKRRMRQLGFNQTTINSFRQKQKKSSSHSTLDQSPIQIRKTTSLINQQKVNEFITQPQLKPKSIISSQEMNCSNLQKELANEDSYYIPKKFREPEKMKGFKLKIIAPLKFLGISGNKISYNKVYDARDSMKEYLSKFHNLKQVPNLGLFYMDLVSIKGRSPDIGIQFKKKLNVLNKFLIYKFQIGMNFIREKLLNIFHIHWQNLIEIVLQRIWNQDAEKQHGFDFFICPKNLQKIKKILLLGNRLTTKFSQSLKDIKLPSLEVLQMNFEKQVDSEELQNIFDNISKYNNRFEIHLVTSIKNKNEFPPFLIEKYGERIYLFDRRLKPSENLQKQRNIEKAKYVKPSYQIKFEEEEKSSIKYPGQKKQQIVNKSIYDEVISRQNIINNGEGTRSEQLSRSQSRSVGNNEVQSDNRTVFGHSQKFNNIHINVSGKLENLKMGNTQQTIKQETIYQHNAQHHHHHVQKIVQQQIIREPNERYSETDYEDHRWRGNSSNYRGRRQYELDSSDEEPDDRGYHYYGRNNYRYNRNYNNYNRNNGYFKKWYQD